MRLTNIIREAFINAAMADVPRVDYDEQAGKLVLAAILKEFKATFPGADYKKAGADGWLDRHNYDLPHPLRAPMFYGPRGYKRFVENTELWAELRELANKKREQSLQRDALKSKLHGIAYSVTTRKALADALPEFEQYLPPKEEPLARSLPAVANVVADFLAAGWPKDHEQAKKVAEAAIKRLRVAK